MTESEISIRVSGVTKTFGEGASAFHALSDVSVDIRKNEFFTLLGPSGCGKTTLLRLIAGFDHPTSGRIELDGEDISQLAPFQRPVNTVFQSYALFPHMTVAQNIGFGLEMLDRPKAEVAATVAQMLSLVRMEALADRRTDQISGGQQQRVALARALAPHPKVLLLDEPLSALDYKLRKDMQIELKRLQSETGITFVFVTHDQEEALTMSDRIAVMNQGTILQIGSPREIYDRPEQRFVADFIGDSNFLEAELLTGGASGRLRLGSGHEIEASVPEGMTAPRRVSVSIRPEHAALTSGAEDAALTGTLKEIVYFGTDTHYHVALGSGGSFIVRRQNSRGVTETLEPGAAVGISLGPRSVQVLRD
ncbi:ABC transporter ATP-binding protein [Limibaculum sp. M0105]|uniref:Spermidine/putrescine import ATP-binding protein PotA n=1 Tax=Thermohalobaculum xanthum TaxID=2753746 RepID=A0A8J7SE61_9RHOB|nr:ABC transporter ATP-binding protein [Thermohalobaculum xanthum]MBK0398787.1 ABC transporter ATP-binding protein [Thermohalobaculum xanthum]